MDHTGLFVIKKRNTNNTHKQVYLDITEKENTKSVFISFNKITNEWMAFPVNKGQVDYSQVLAETRVPSSFKEVAHLAKEELFS